MTQQTNSTTWIELPSDLINVDAAELQQALVAALEAGGPVTLRADAVSRIGTVGLQLLLALRLSAAARGLAVSIETPSQALRDAARSLGLEKQLGLS